MDTDDENPLVKIINDYKENHEQLEKLIDEREVKDPSLVTPDSLKQSLPKESSFESLDYSKTNEVGGDSVEDSSNSKEESAGAQSGQARQKNIENSASAED